MKYTDSEIFSKIDHTLLRGTATLAEIYQLCNEAANITSAATELERLLGGIS